MKTTLIRTSLKALCLCLMLCMLASCANPRTDRRAAGAGDTLLPADANDLILEDANAGQIEERQLAKLTLTSSDFTVTDTSIPALYQKALSLTSEAGSIEYSSVSSDITNASVFEVCLAAHEAGKPYAAAAYLAAKEHLLETATAENGALTVVSDDAYDPALAAMLTMLDSDPNSYYMWACLFDTPEEYDAINWDHPDPFYLCTTYAEHGYESTEAYVTAARKDPSLDHGDIYVLSLRQSSIAQNDTPIGVSLTDVWSENVAE